MSWAIALSPGDDPDQPDRLPILQRFVDGDGRPIAREDVRIGHEAESLDQIETACGIGKVDRPALASGQNLDENVHPKSVITTPLLRLAAPR